MEQNERLEKYNTLRKDYPEFVYNSYDLEETADSLKVTYRFQITGLSSFAPTWTFPKPAGCDRAAIAEALEPMLFSLGMVELVSYWKITCSPRVVIRAGALEETQIKWWKDLYFNGLGEFFYVNHIIDHVDAETFMKVTVDSGKKKGSSAALALSQPGKYTASFTKPQRVLVPIGGGKDSVVTLELLKKAGQEIFGYIINPRGATSHTAEVAGLDADHLITVKRTLDPNMLDLNRQGFLNGHTPFSALVAFSTEIAAKLFDLPFIALSNESSANESTVAGSTVNHQYSKSFQFEQDFHEYAAAYLPESSYYFSMLRPLSEFQIARFFSGCKQYHKIFRSCNAGSKEDKWCGHCPKCLFVYLILSPFLGRQEVREIFGTDMLEDETMRSTFGQLIGLVEEKPFECVGSRSEINTAVVLAIRKFEAAGDALPALFTYYKTTDLYPIYEKLGDQFSDQFDTENLVPADWEALVKANATWDTEGNAGREAKHDTD